MMRVIIIDDDPLFRELLSTYLEKTDAQLVGKFNNPVEAIKFLKEGTTDLIFLDLHMPEMKGDEFLATFQDLPPVILTTSDPDFAVTAFTYDVVGYLLKPFSFADFQKAFEKASKSKVIRANSDQSEAVFVKKGSSIHRLSKKDILYLECIGDYATLYTSGDKFVIHGSMKSLEQIFPEPDFVRVHRSFIVRFDKVNLIQDDDLVFGDKLIPVGKTYKQYVFSKFKMI